MTSGFGVINMLIENEHKYYLLFESLNESIIIFDGETRKILDANKKALETFGYTKSELTEMKIESLSFEAMSTINTVPEVIKEKIKKIPIRWYQKKDGIVFPVSIIAGKYLWENKTIICCLVRDISDYLNENIKKIDLINKICQLEDEIKNFIEIINTNYVQKPPINLFNLGITEKEQNVIFLITQGLSNKEISAKLCVAEITVKKQITTIFKKLKIKKRKELTDFIFNNKIKF